MRVPLKISMIFRLLRLRCRHLLIFHFMLVGSCAPLDSDFLLKFKASLQTDNASSSSSSSLGLDTWNVSTSPCSGQWVGIRCNREGRVWGIRLENMSLKGFIDVASLKSLSDLRSISLMRNQLEGPLPDIAQLGALKSLYLSDNQFSGAMEGALFLRMGSLKKLHLARNQLEGSIPVSLALLPRLVELRLEDNMFEGLVPNFAPRNWLSFNLSNNSLHGRVPSGLTALNASSFYGNKGLCGKPLNACWAYNSSLISIVVLGVVVVMALSAIGAMLIILCRCTRLITPPSQPHQEPTNDIGHHITNIPPSSPARSATSGAFKLWFLRDDRERFQMQELLSASAEMLGSGNLGSSYKAALGGPTLSPVTVVVKRFKQMNNVGREEFYEHMRRIGTLRHPNVLPLVALYYKKDEKLLISDFVENGSLAFHLHGGGNGRWMEGRTRLNIAKGVARGLKYLHEELPSVMAAHGHLKASNVLLKDYSLEPLLSDYGLIPLMNQEHAQQQMTAYKSPEYRQHGRITKKTDVWSLGMLILEILTGKLADGEDDLVEWARDEDNVHVFERELLVKSDGETMVMLEKLLRIGIDCCEADVEKRLDMKQVVHKIENLKHYPDTTPDLVQTFHSTTHIQIIRSPSSNEDHT